jgi:site-specific DNA-cytosine methylase
MVGQFQTLAGIDCDLEACQDFETLTGAPSVQMDLFGRDDYAAFHGQVPSADWQEVTALDLFESTKGECPDVVFLSPPCKGFSGLLPSEKSKSDKYQALNRLVIRGLQLTMDAYADDLPAVIMLENVPRITSRGEFLLKQVKHLLGKHGYVFHEGYHDCGEMGGLGQHRKRYLLIARLKEKMPSFIYRPHTKRVKSIGEVLGMVPLPDDPSMGPMHRLPRLQWKTWVRLALIPAGGDWRDLENAGQYQIEHVKRGSGSLGVQDWDKPGHTVIGNAKVGGSSASAISDPRLNLKNGHQALYRVSPWEKPANTITGAHGPNNGAISIADPRVPKWRNGWKLSAAEGRVTAWDQPTDVVLGHAGVRSNGAANVADPRLTCKPRSGMMGVQDWNKPGATVIGAGDIHSGATAIADPRIPRDTEVLDPPPVIIALDGTRHRPLTTLELAALQGFPLTMPDGSALKLAGNSDARWRERIGNAVPPPAAEAIAEEILLTLMMNGRDEWQLSTKGIWVTPEAERGVLINVH